MMLEGVVTRRGGELAITYVGKIERKRKPDLQNIFREIGLGNPGTRIKKDLVQAILDVRFPELSDMPDFPPKKT